MNSVGLCARTIYSESVCPRVEGHGISLLAVPKYIFPNTTTSSSFAEGIVRMRYARLRRLLLINLSTSFTFISTPLLLTYPTSSRVPPLSPFLFLLRILQLSRYIIHTRFFFSQQCTPHTANPLTVISGGGEFGVDVFGLGGACRVACQNTWGEGKGEGRPDASWTSAGCRNCFWTTNPSTS